MESRRSERISEAIREELEEILNFELTDPRIGTVSVPEVVVSTGGRRAVVRVVLEGDASAKKQSLDALKGARGYVRRLLAERIDMFRIPDIEFEPVVLSPVSDTKVAHLLRRVRKGRPRDQEELD
jgi:ribosome-binding factor A